MVFYVRWSSVAFRPSNLKHRQTRRMSQNHLSMCALRATLSNVCVVRNFASQFDRRQLQVIRCHLPPSSLCSHTRERTRVINNTTQRKVAPSDPVTTTKSITTKNLPTISVLFSCFVATKSAAFWCIARQRWVPSFKAVFSSRGNFIPSDTGGIFATIFCVNTGGRHSPEAIYFTRKPKLCI